MCRCGKAQAKAKGSNQSEKKKKKKKLNIEILQENFILLTTNKLLFTIYIEKYTYVLINSAYIEYEYKYLTHKLYEYEYLKKITRVPSTSASGLVEDTI